MRKALLVMVLASPLLFLLFHVPTVDIPAVFAQTPDGEHNCPATTAIPPYVGLGTGVFSPNQNLCLPRLAPVGGSTGPIAFIVQASSPATASIRREPSTRSLSGAYQAAWTSGAGIKPRMVRRASMERSRSDMKANPTTAESSPMAAPKTWSA